MERSNPKNNFFALFLILFFANATWHLRARESVLARVDLITFLSRGHVTRCQCPTIINPNTNLGGGYRDKTRFHGLRRAKNEMTPCKIRHVKAKNVTYPRLTLMLLPVLNHLQAISVNQRDAAASKNGPSSLDSNNDESPIKKS